MLFICHLTYLKMSDNMVLNTTRSGSVINKSLLLWFCKLSLSLLRCFSVDIFSNLKVNACKIFTIKKYNSNLNYRHCQFECFLSPVSILSSNFSQWFSWSTSRPQTWYFVTLPKSQKNCHIFMDYIKFEATYWGINLHENEEKYNLKTPTVLSQPKWCKYMEEWETYLEIWDIYDIPFSHCCWTSLFLDIWVFLRDLPLLE